MIKNQRGRQNCQNSGYKDLENFGPKWIVWGDKLDLAVEKEGLESSWYAVQKSQANSCKFQLFWDEHAEKIFRPAPEHAEISHVGRSGTHRDSAAW